MSLGEINISLFANISCVNCDIEVDAEKLKDLANFVCANCGVTGVDSISVKVKAE